jgi:murein DD-endopeptidase MepM/ murein hydrolase activator NlpD
MNARYYLPEVGRFISPDTIVPEPKNPQSYNRYSYVQNSPVNYTDPTGHNRDCGMGDPICNGDRSVMAGGWGSVSRQDIADPIEDYYRSGYSYAPGKPGERSNAVGGGTVHNGVDLESDSTHEVGALSTGIVRVADSCAIAPCNGSTTPAANFGTGSVVIVEYPYQVIPDQVREDFGLTSDMSMYVQYQHLDEISSSIVAGRAVTANDIIGQYGNTGASRGEHLHLEIHVGPSQQLGMGRIDGTYDTHSNNWHNSLTVSDPNSVLNTPNTPR